MISIVIWDDGKAGIKRRNGDWWTNEESWCHESSSHWEFMNCGPDRLVYPMELDSYREAIAYAVDKGWIDEDGRNPHA